MLTYMSAEISLICSQSTRLDSVFQGVGASKASGGIYAASYLVYSG